MEVQVLSRAQKDRNIPPARDFLLFVRRSNVLSADKTASRGRENFLRRQKVICDLQTKLNFIVRAQFKHVLARVVFGMEHRGVHFVSADFVKRMLAFALRMKRGAIHLIIVHHKYRLIRGAGRIVARVVHRVAAHDHLRLQCVHAA